MCGLIQRHGTAQHSTLEARATLSPATRPVVFSISTAHRVRCGQWTNRASSPDSLDARTPQGDLNTETLGRVQALPIRGRATKGISVCRKKGISGPHLAPRPEKHKMDLTSPAAALRSLARRAVPAADLAEAQRAMPYFLPPRESTPPPDSEIPTLAHLEEALLALARSPCWESNAAAFVCSKDAMPSLSDDFFAAIQRIVKEAALEHTEPRVRSTAVGVIEQLAKRRPAATWEDFGNHLVELVDRNFDLDAEERAHESERLAARSLTRLPPKSGEVDMQCPLRPGVAQMRRTQLFSVICAVGADSDEQFPFDKELVPEQQSSAEASGGRPRSNSRGSATSYYTRGTLSADLVHETMGWKALETSMRALQSLVKGYGPSFVRDGLLTRDLFELISRRALAHQNRYVREVGYDLCAAIAGASFASLPSDETQQVVDALVGAVSRGLSDNWSQVRFAASVAARSLMLGLGAEGRLQRRHLDQVLPRMCLNRYYLAEGVRLYSQESWKQVFGDTGAVKVAEHMRAVVDYYVSQASADNHAVREAACHCIAELASKVNRTQVAPHVTRLLAALVDCFKDESWPVRDAACVACGSFVSNFPTESALMLPELYSLWFEHLSDNIWSVREDSAVALGLVLKCPELREDAMARVKQQLGKLLPAVQSQMAAGQDADSHTHAHQHAHEHSHSHTAARESAHSPSPVLRGNGRPRSGSGGLRIHKGSIAELRHKRDMGEQDDLDEKHTDQAMFSCGSLAPKLRRGVGCMDHGFSRPKEPWESSDGAVYLLRSLAEASSVDAEAFLPELAATVLAARHFEQAYLLKETVWKQLPAIAQAIGKRPFKRYLDEFLRPLILSADSDQALESFAARSCLAFLQSWVGEGVLRGRVEALEPDGHELVRRI